MAGNEKKITVKVDVDTSSVDSKVKNAKKKLETLNTTANVQVDTKKVNEQIKTLVKKAQAQGLTKLGDTSKALTKSLNKTSATFTRISKNISVATENLNGSFHNFTKSLKTLSYRFNSLANGANNVLKGVKAKNTATASSNREVKRGGVAIPAEFASEFANAKDLKSLIETNRKMQAKMFAGGAISDDIKTRIQSAKTTGDINAILRDSGAIEYQKAQEKAAAAAQQAAAAQKKAQDAALAAQRRAQEKADRAQARYVAQQQKQAEKIAAQQQKEADRLAAQQQKEADRLAAQRRKYADKIAVHNQKEVNRITALHQAREVEQQKKQGSANNENGGNQSTEGAKSEKPGIKQRIADSTRVFAKRMGTYASYAIINDVAQAVKALGASAVNLESEFANIQAITSATDSTMSSLKDTILSVGESSKYTTEEIADATVQLGQAGLSAEEIDNVLESTTQLAAATGSSLSDTVDLMTSTLAVWGLNSNQAEHLSDVMVTGMNKTKATLQTFRMAVQYAGATVASLNGSFEDLAAVASAASNAGLRASVIGTGMRGVIAELISPTAKMKKGLADLGLTTEDVNIRSKGLVNVLQTLKDAGLNASNAYDMFGRRAATFALAAQSQLDVVNDLQVAFAETGATERAYSLQMNTVKSQWTALTNTIKEGVYNVLESTDGMIHTTMENLRKFLQWSMTETSDELKKDAKAGARQVTSVENYQSILSGLEDKDYKGRLSAAISEFNALVKSINRAYDLQLALVKTAEELPEAYRKAEEILNSKQLEKAAETNRSLTRSERSVIAERYFGTRTHTNRFFSGLSKIDIDKAQEGQPIIGENGKDYTSQYSKYMFDPSQSILSAEAGEYIGYNFVEFYKLANSYMSRLTKEGLDAGYENARKQIESDYGKNDFRLKVLHRNALEAAKDAYNSESQKIDENEISVSKNTRKLSQISNSAFGQLPLDLATSIKSSGYTPDSLIEQYNESKRQIAAFEDALQDNMLSSKDKQLFIDKLESLKKEGDDETTQAFNDNIQKKIDFIKNIPEDQELEPSAIQAIRDKLAEMRDTLLNNFLKVSDQIIELSELKIGEMLENGQEAQAKALDESLERLKKAGREEKGDDTELDELIYDAKKESQRRASDARARQQAARSAREAQSRKLQAFELSYQQAGYNQEIGEAESKGYAARLSKVEPRGGYYTDQFQGLSEQKSELLEQYNAKKSMEVLDKYKGEYGDLFDKVRHGQITLEDANEKSDRAIQKMIELDKTIAEARAKYGSLDTISLDGLKEQIAGVTEEMKKTTEQAEETQGTFGNWMNNLKSGYAKGFQDMKDSYSAQSIGQTISQDISKGMSDAVISVAEGNKSIKDSFSDMAESVVRNIAHMLINAGMNQMIGAPSTAASGDNSGSAGSGIIGAVQNFFGGKANGGLITAHFAGGQKVRGGTPYRDSVPSMLMPGEYVLKKSAVDTLGTNFLNDLNNNAAQTIAGTAANLMQPVSDTGSSSGEASVVNVWVVSERDQAQMGPNDVIATIGKDIATGGQTRRLIQSVIAGRK